MNIFIQKKLVEAVKAENVDLVKQILDEKPTCENVVPTLFPQWFHIVIDSSGQLAIEISTVGVGLLIGIGTVLSVAILDPNVQKGISQSTQTFYEGVIAGASSVNRIFSSSKEKEKEKKEVKTVDPTPIYYHATTLENALLIKESGMLVGSSMEGGYVYAWKLPPTQYAISQSGARGDVVISFTTIAPFSRDRGIEDTGVQLFYPVVSVFPGPIIVNNVEIIAGG